MAEDKMFYVGQKAFIDKDGEVLVLFDEAGLDFPGGKLQEGETDYTKALKREVREETTLEIEIGKPFTTWSFTMSIKPEHIGKKVFLVGYKCSYKSGDVSLSNEHQKYQWVNKDNYHKLKDGTEYFKALEEYFEPSS